ncbi:KISc [Nesidiocoris tenuis]|uniref:KISc n=1 Tax=Nesidiocoris tenuis TaxID=355587 RepID=A0ABN7BH11_9HEMI|nr:KISc [Nesidiocoris tenuis]
METVQVAVRIRPLVPSEIEHGCRSCLDRIPGEPQISIGRNNQMFTFNYVFDENEGQGKVYNDAVKGLIENLFKGYNLTILAYGQTGSGKTFTMGTNYSGQGELGVIPRVLYEIFEQIEARTDYSFVVSVSFLELYNEALYDLLTDKPKEQSIVDMREASDGICIPGLTEKPVKTADAALSVLVEGSSGRVVGATAMNATSSRSHAVFTINFKIVKKDNPKEVMASKFHLVDLAGSERSKKTGATGDRFKEGININKGLLVLGNVISQLCEGNQSFINYRDSKLTRLLQDSLGGNSVTLMIACVSPADYNRDETVSTLRYADRARKIKNKPIVNQDPVSAEIARLRKENEELRLKIIGDGVSMFDCPPEHKLLKEKLEQSEKRAAELSNLLYCTLEQNSLMHQKIMVVDKQEESRREKLQELSQTVESESLDGLKSKLNQLMNDYEVATKERVNEENKSLTEYTSEDAEVDEETSSTRHAHIVAQAKINKEIGEVSKKLVWKEELMAKLCESANNLGVIGGQESVDELRKQIAELQAEKELLHQQIKDATLSTISSANQAKVLEQRRKRLQELEQKVHNLMKKCAEQERLLKMKECSEEKIKKLRTEIMEGKQLKVRLIQQMKTEGDRFRSYKQEKDREVCLLRSQNQKKQNQLKKMEQIHAMQQNVLKRKLEAAAAANKRIMATLERQKQAKLKRMKSSPMELIKDKVSEEMELIESEYQAQRSLDNLIQDRAALKKQLNCIMESLKDPSISQEEKAKLHQDMKDIEDDLAMRSAEIGDLQQKLSDIHQDDAARANWDIVQTMTDAKFAITHVMSLASEKVKDCMNATQKLTETKEQKWELELLCDDLKQKIESKEREIDATVKEYEEKLYLLINWIRHPEKASNPEQIMLGELEKMEHMRNRIAELEEELKKFKKVNSYEDAFRNYVDDQEKENKKRKMKSRESHKAADTTFSVMDVDDEDEDTKDFDASLILDNEVQPVWVKTPLYKRMESLKSMTLLQSKSSSNNSDDAIDNKRMR